jgi:hypothetical protein
VIKLPEERDVKWDRERRAFYRLLPSLISTLRNKYVAIHEEKVVESGDSVIETAERAYARFGYIPIYLGLVTDQVSPPVRMRSPRLVRGRALALELE